MSRTNEKRTPIQEFEKMSVKVNYFWAFNEEGLVACDDLVKLPCGWLHAKVKVELLEFTENFEALDVTKDFSTLQLFVNDEFIGELVEFEATDKLIKCSVVVGAG